MEYYNTDHYFEELCGVTKDDAYIVKDYTEKVWDLEEFTLKYGLVRDI